MQRAAACRGEFAAVELCRRSDQRSIIDRWLGGDKLKRTTGKQRWLLGDRPGPNRPDRTERLSVEPRAVEVTAPLVGRCEQIFAAVDRAAGDHGHRSLLKTVFSNGDERMHEGAPALVHAAAARLR